jgi:hypothetical protein
MLSYSPVKHDPNMHGHKVAHAYKRLLELSIVQRALSEEIKDLSDFLQAYSQGRSIYKKANNFAAKANTTAEPKKTNSRGIYGIAKARMEAKQEQEQEQEQQAQLPLTQPEEDPMDKLKKQIVHALMVCSTDYPDDVSYAIKAPPKLVARIRTQLVDAGKLRPLEDRHEQSSGQTEAPQS